jgi:hypothetical protein
MSVTKNYDDNNNDNDDAYIDRVHITRKEVFVKDEKQIENEIKLDLYNKLTKKMNKFLNDNTYSLKVKNLFLSSSNATQYCIRDYTHDSIKFRPYTYSQVYSLVKNNNIHIMIQADESIWNGYSVRFITLSHSIELILEMNSDRSLCVLM